MKLITIKSNTINIRTKIIICQKRIGNLLDKKEIEVIKEFEPDFICLPELFFITDDMKNYADAAQAHDVFHHYLKNLSLEMNMIVIGGTLILLDSSGFCSICYVFDKGKITGNYQKMNLTNHELKEGFIPGKNYVRYHYKDILYTTLICNDIFSEDGFTWAGNNRIQLIFMPTGSPCKPQDTIEDKFRRDQELYVAQSVRSNSIIIKICAVGSVFGNRLQGRSLVADPSGILIRINPSEEMNECLLGISLEA